MGTSSAHFFMKRRIIQSGIIVIFAIFLFAIALTTNMKPKYEKEKLTKTTDVMIEKEEETKSDKEIKKENADSNLTDIQAKLEDVNKKYEQLKQLIPSDYTELGDLEAQINNLNNSINQNASNISSENDISSSTLDNLNAISDSLDQLIQVFSN